MATENLEESALQQQIQAEQIDILFRQAPLAQATNLLVASVFAWFLWNIAPHQMLLGWWCAIAALVLFRLGLVIGYRRRNAGSRVAWGTLMTGAAACSGVVWGAAGVLFFRPDSPVALIFVTVILAGMAAGSIPSHFSWPPAQFTYVILAMTPITLRYLFEGGALSVLGLMCLIYLFNVLVFARQLSRTVIESIRLRLEKQELVQQLRAEMSAAQQARTRAEDANLAKSRFLAAASHDLRQPLHAMNLFVEVLRSEKDPARAGTVLTHLSAASQSLEDLLNELLDISKLEAGLFKPQIKVLSVQEIFDALDHELWPVAKEKGLVLRFAATRLKIESDASMLGRILRNIITNAIRYTEQGAVLVGCRRRGNRVAIAIYDTGPGIAPEHHQAIFREFYQLGNPERDRRKGLGLGLAIVDGLCRVLDCPLDLKSRLGRGTMFSVAVPLAVGDQPPEEPAREIVSHDLQGVAVLVIDDEPAICMGMSDLLKCWGCSVLAAESEHAALTQLARERFSPDVIIVDYRLREGCTGTEAILEIRRTLGRAVPAAILTGDTSPERLREASASGFLLLHKPVQPERLRAALYNLRG